MASGNTAQMKKLRVSLRDQGFDVELVKNGHWRVTSKDGRKCQISNSPSCHRSEKNAVSRLRRLVGYVPTT